MDLWKERARRSPNLVKTVVLTSSKSQKTVFVAVGLALLGALVAGVLVYSAMDEVSRKRCTSCKK